MAGGICTICRGWCQKYTPYGFTIGCGAAAGHLAVAAPAILLEITMDKEEAIDQAEKSQSNWRYRNSKAAKDKKDVERERIDHD